MRPAVLSIAAGGAAVAGALVGVVAERGLMARFFTSSGADEAYGSLHGESVRVVADDGTSLYAEVDEPEDPRFADVTVVFSHGYSLNLDTWHYQRRDLRGRARLVFWDQRSHGRSQRGPQGSATIDQLGRDLAAVIAECAPTGRIVLVGHSMGGMTVMSLAAHDPDLFGDRVGGVALLATSAGHLSDVTLRLPAPAARVLQRHTEDVATLLAARAADVDRSRKRTSDLTFLMTKRYSFGEQRVSRAHTQFVADLLGSTPIEVVAEYLPEFSRHDKAEALAALQRVQTLVMVGDNDALTPDSHSSEIVRRVPGAELVIVPDTGHMIISERPEIVDRHLVDLLATVRDT